MSTRSGAESRPYLGLSRAKHVGPLACVGDQLGSHGILADVEALGVEVFIIAQAVIEEVALPLNFRPMAGEVFPSGNHFWQRFVRWKTGQEMEVVGHREKQPQVPASHLVIVQGGRLQDFPCRRGAELILSLGLGAEGDEVNGSIGYMMRYFMR